MPSDADYHAMLSAMREHAELMGRLAGSVAALEQSASNREARLLAIEAALVPVSGFFSAQTRAAADAAADLSAAEVHRKAARVSFVAALTDWLTVRRIVALAAILVPLCGGGGTLAGALGSERMSAALAVLLSAEPAEPAPSLPPSEVPDVASPPAP